MDSYGMQQTNPQNFFAVATGLSLKKAAPIEASALYEQLQRYYQLDPVLRF